MGDNIIYQIKEQKNENEFDINKLMEDFALDDFILNDDIDIDIELNEFMNLTLKQLMIIYDFYGLIKSSKYKKCDIIEQILLFESDITNYLIVQRRLTFWEYMNRLKLDKNMKKYIIWA
jgi:hypothetical protein